MRQLTTHRDVRPLLTAVPSGTPLAGDAALLAEVVELRAQNEQLGRALATRATIDQALGMVMVLAPCSSERAWDLLVEVSQHSNIKLRDVAAALVAITQDETLPEPVQRELCRALRRLHAANRG